MNGTLFTSILVGGALLTALLTQAIKQWYYNKGQEAPPNLIALINSVVVGGLGTAIIYIWLDIPWTVKNILALVVMVLFVWIGSMIGYSKIFESLQQFKKWRESQEPSIPDDALTKIEEAGKKKVAETKEKEQAPLDK